MIPEPLDSRRVDPAEQIRAGARRQAQNVSRATPVFLAIGMVVFIMAVLIIVDYKFVMETHRVVKILLGFVALGAIVAMPRVGLLLLPVITPFLAWVPPTPLPGLNPLNVLLFSIFGTFMLKRVMARQAVFRPTRLGMPLFWLLLICALSIIRGAAAPTGYTYNPFATGLQLFRSAMSFTPYLIYMAMVEDRKQRRQIAWAVIVGLLLEALITLKLGRNGSGMRATGTIGQANELGTFLALYVIIAVALVAGTRNWLGKAVLLAAAGLGAVGVLLSVSRGSMVAMFVGLLVVSWRTSKLLVAAMVAVVLLAPFWLPDYVMDRIKGSAVQVEGSDQRQVDNSSERRLETWSTIMTVVQDHAIDGVGFAGLAYVLPDLGNELGFEEVKDSAHNTFLRMLSEMGIFGLLLFCWVLWTIWRLADDGVRRARDGFDRALAVGLCGAIIALAASCAFGDRFFNIIISGNFWIVCALVDGQLLDAPPPAAAAPVERAAAARPRRFFRKATA